VTVVGKAAGGVVGRQRNLRDFLALLERRGQLRRIGAPVDPDLELAAIADRVLALGGPALLFENVIGSPLPVAVNLMGTVERVLWSMGMERPEELEALGERLALLQQPRPPKGIKELRRFGGVFWDLVRARPDHCLTAPVSIAAGSAYARSVASAPAICVTRLPW